MHQISEMADAKLDKLSREIGELEKAIEEAERDRSKKWQKVFDIFDEFYRGGQEARFIASDGHTLCRQISVRVGKLDDTQVYEALVSSYPNIRALRLWVQITKRVVDPDKLKNAILDGRIAGAVIENVLPQTKEIASRIRRAWTKDDEEKAIVYKVRKEK